MKTGVLTTKTIASEGLEKSVMGMSQRGMEMATYFLRDRIYTDKILAFIREYICNAQDEHIKHNIERPVEVKLLQQNNQWVWSVRDFALGLSEYDVRNVFAMYFESTKSGDNTCIGGFGVGGKAGFSYSDTFFITSYFEGVKTTYVCTLGASASGIPVGECYKVSQEPTTEQGIEISLDVTKDCYKVSLKTETFVNAFSPDAKIEFYSGYDMRTYTPHLPLLARTEGDFIINQYSDYPISTGYGQNYFVRMGGVNYSYKTATKRPRAIRKHIIVDVPVGMLTVPITRESIENLPANEKVFEEIENILDMLGAEEMKNFTTPKFGDIVSLSNGTFRKTFEGTWFNYEYNVLFPKTQKYYYKVHRGFSKENTTNWNESIPANNGKHMIFVFPNIKNLNNWHARLQNALKQIGGVDYKGYLWMSSYDHMNILSDVDGSIDLSDCVFADIKKLKLPKLEKGPSDDTTYQVFEGYGHKRYYTPEQLNTKITENHFGGVEPDDDWCEKVTSKVQLDFRTIGDARVFGTRSSIITANSKKLIDALKEMGWLSPDDDEYKNKVAEFSKIEEQLRREEKIKYNANSVFFGMSCAERTKKILIKHPDKFQKLEEVVRKIRGEHSLRNRIVGTLRDYSMNITRKDLRKILNMK